jgi:hypothetical protein
VSTSKDLLVLSADAHVTCPKCEHEFALADGFAKHALEGVESASATAMAKLRADERATAERQAQQRAAETDAVHRATVANVRKLAEESFAPQMAELKAQADAAAVRAAQQRAQVQQLQSEQLALREERQKLQDQKSAMALDVQRQVDARLSERDLAVRSQEQERAKFEKAELQKKLDDLSAQLADAQTRASQGSQQLQGEVLELELETTLRRAFPLDRIEEVKKGQRGGDVLQHVTTRNGQTAGVILWETKRARDWSAQWISKLKDDMRAGGAALGILVTMPGTLPKDWPAGELFAPYDDVWVTQNSTAIGVAEALRSGLIEVQRQRAIAAGKGEKMEALYDYLTSPQFAQKLKAVYETFMLMSKELEQEKSVTLQRWARREKQLTTGVAQLLGVGGEIQGLAQQELPMLNLQSDEGTA